MVFHPHVPRGTTRNLSVKSSLRLRLVCAQTFAACHVCQVKTSRMPSWWWSYLWLVGEDTSWLKLGTFFQLHVLTDVLLSLMWDIFLVLCSVWTDCCWNKRWCYRLSAWALAACPAGISATVAAASQRGSLPQGYRPAIQAVSHPRLDTKSVCLSSHVSCSGGLWQARKTTSVFIWDETRQ